MLLRPSLGLEGAFLLELLLLFSRKERRVGFVPECLAYAAENERRIGALLSSPLPKPPYKHTKQPSHSEYCLKKKQSISGKTVENTEIFKQNKKENNFIKRQQKMVGNDSQIRNLISLTHTEKEGENNAEERLFLYQFFSNVHQSHY